MFIRNPLFYEYYRKHLLGLQGEELGDRTWENESTTWKGYGAPLPSYVAFFFHFKKNHRFVTEENIQVGKEGKKGGTGGGRKGEREERTKRGGKKE